jgi:hypothetical protein
MHVWCKKHQCRHPIDKPCDASIEAYRLEFEAEVREGERQRKKKAREKSNDINDRVQDATVENVDESPRYTDDDELDDEGDHRKPRIRYLLEDERGTPKCVSRAEFEAVEEANLKGMFMMNCGKAIEVALEATKHYSGPIDEEMATSCRRVADAWIKLANRSKVVIEDDILDDWVPENERLLPAVRERRFWYRVLHAQDYAKHNDLEGLEITAEMLEAVDAAISAWTQLRKQMDVGP